MREKSKEYPRQSSNQWMTSTFIFSLTIDKLYYIIIKVLSQIMSSNFAIPTVILI